MRIDLQRLRIRRDEILSTVACGETLGPTSHGLSGPLVRNPIPGAGSTLRVVADEDRLPERIILASAPTDPPPT
jgi:hypothetical protein